MAQRAPTCAGSRNIQETESETARACQLLWHKRELKDGSKLLYVRQRNIHKDIASQRAEAPDKMGRLSENVGLLYQAAEGRSQHLGMMSKSMTIHVCQKSRMRENRTYGSVRGSRQSLHDTKIF